MSTQTSQHVLIEALATQWARAATTGRAGDVDLVSRRVARLGVERAAQTVATAYERVAARIGVITAEEAGTARALIAGSLTRVRARVADIEASLWRRQNGEEQSMSTAHDTTLALAVERHDEQVQAGQAPVDPNMRIINAGIDLAGWDFAPGESLDSWSPEQADELRAHWAELQAAVAALTAGVTH